jgi:hypothetical protein
VVGVRQVPTSKAPLADLPTGSATVVDVRAAVAARRQVETRAIQLSLAVPLLLLVDGLVSACCLGRLVSLVFTNR